MSAMWHVALVLASLWGVRADDASDHLVVRVLVSASVAELVYRALRAVR